MTIVNNATSSEWSNTIARLRRSHLRGAIRENALMLALVKMFDMRNVGTCPKCIRLSFLTMLLVCASACYLWTFGVIGTLAFFGISIPFMCLWMAHVIRRASLSFRLHRQHDGSKRLALRLGLALMGSVATSIAFPWDARADSACGGWGGNSGCDSCDRYGVGRCMRQNSACGCYYCRSCGSDCGDNVC